MRYIVETSQQVLTSYLVDAESPAEAHLKFRSGEYEEVDQNVLEEFIEDIYED